MKDKIKEYWKNRWIKNETAFHQDKVEEALIRAEKFLTHLPSKRALVPLCGKSLDLMWLYKKGFEVHGIELSELAVQDFYKENNLGYKIKKFAEGNLFYSNKIHIFQGNFFQIPEELKKKYQFDLIYDRASLIALNKPDRLLYYEIIKSMMKEDSILLLLIFESTKVPPKIPPYPISENEIFENFKKKFQIQKIEERSDRKERVYLIKKL